MVDRNAVALVQTPERTGSWKPVVHIEFMEAVTEEQFEPAREGQKLFSVMKINKTSSSEGLLHQIA